MNKSQAFHKYETRNPPVLEFTIPCMSICVRIYKSQVITNYNASILSLCKNLNLKLLQLDYRRRTPSAQRCD